MSKGAVVLIPGIGFFGLELALLRSRLQHAGYDAGIFFYCGWHTPLEACVARLRDFLLARVPDGAHLVCHSLGGLVATRLLSAGGSSRPRRLVTLATPHLGALAARKLSRFQLGRSLLGRDLLAALDAPPCRLPPQVELGTIAGSLNPGLGGLWGLSEPNDGLIRIAETLHPDAADRLTVPSTHASLLLSRQVADQVVRFLAHGSFAR